MLKCMQACAKAILHELVELSNGGWFAGFAFRMQGPGWKAQGFRVVALGLGSLFRALGVLGGASGGLRPVEG